MRRVAPQLKCGRVTAQILVTRAGKNRETPPVKRGKAIRRSAREEPYREHHAATEQAQTCCSTLSGGPCSFNIGCQSDTSAASSMFERNGPLVFGRAEIYRGKLLGTVTVYSLRPGRQFRARRNANGDVAIIVCCGRRCRCRRGRCWFAELGFKSTDREAISV